MKMTFKVTYQGGKEVDAIAWPIDILKFERQYNASFTTFTELSPMEHLWFLAWAPLNRTGQDPREFDAFMTDVEEISVVADQAPVRPTKRGRSAMNSPSSPSSSE